MKQTFTKRIFLFLSLVIPIPLVLNLITLTLFSFSAAKNNLIQNLHTHATNFSLEFEKKLFIHKVFMKRLAHTLALKGYAHPNEDFYAQAYNEIQTLPTTDFSLCLMPSNGTSIKTRLPRHPFIQYLKAHPEFTQELQKKTGQALFLTLPNKSSEQYLVLVENIDLQNINIESTLLIGFYNLSDLKKELFKSLSLNQEDICVIDKERNVIFSSNPIFDAKDVPNIAKSTTLEKSKNYPQISDLSSQEQDLISICINNKNYLGLFLHKLPVPDTYTLSLIPRSALLAKAIKLPLNVAFFYTIAFILMGIVLTKANRRLNQPVQELTICMEAAWRGDHDVRYEPQPDGYEINDLGNIFNCTLLQLLNLKEKAAIELASGDKLQKELAILESLQQALLNPPFPSFPGVRFISKHLQGRQLSGHFYGWKTIKQTELIGAFGIAGDIGLPSYLYALSARSLFLAYADSNLPIEKISQSTFDSFENTTEGNEAQISMSFLHYNINDHQIYLTQKGTTPPAIFLKRENNLLRPPIHEHYNIHTNDILIFVTGSSDLIDQFSLLPIDSLLKDPLQPINSTNFVDSLIDLVTLQSKTEIDGTLSFLFFD
ncbi:putative regulator of sigma subunit [Chlamydia ibidis]|uniref:Regulator of sigma subunit n=2 Tax=Chlamydia ibidis TaxID=1405396 RepID=A0ABN0N051_9CHLA|nr:regulator of sigma subunit [Chlamydia ibidis]EPP34528.1 putative regulator of sigma subunit [Chlamydia ibidis]EQM62977.1 regulator of sigma subunit [Chlamydia ibidis 10-1398/6]